MIGNKGSSSFSGFTFIFIIYYRFIFLQCSSDRTAVIRAVSTVLILSLHYLPNGCGLSPHNPISYNASWSLHFRLILSTTFVVLLTIPQTISSIISSFPKMARSLNHDAASPADLFPIHIGRVNVYLAPRALEPKMESNVWWEKWWCWQSGLREKCAKCIVICLANFGYHS